MPLNAITPAFENALRACLPEASFRDPNAYVEEPRGRIKGEVGLAIAPQSSAEIAAVIRLANEARIGVVPYGGGTGLVLGQVRASGHAPLILSLERMTKIRASYPSENVLIVEAGAILADVQTAAQSIDRLFPLSLASEGSCRIGGNLATNAGGLNVLRYGNARDLCLGIEAVLPDGTIWNGLKRLRKDNTGYDLRNLLIGSEGTLGVITAAALRLFAPPAHNGTALFVVPNPQAALDLLSLAQGQIGEGISAFEILSQEGYNFLSQTCPDTRQPFDKAPEWSVLIGLGLSAQQSTEAAFETLFEAALETGLATDGTIAQSESQAQNLWKLRETIPEANKRIGAIASHDIALPLSTIPEFIARAGERLATLGDMRINCFGHLGDGNLHYNVFPAMGKKREDYADLRAPISRLVHDLTDEYDGSVSAEHGIGRLKVDDLARYSDPAKLAAMRAIKGALDPNGIMNPGAILPEIGQ
ncbi:MAG: FAD-binding oxidoreductase [Paracoccaceae bacterium]